MNLNSIINMVIRMVMRRTLNKGIGAATRKMGGKSGRTTAAHRVPGAKGREAAKRARQAARITRRLGR